MDLYICLLYSNKCLSFTDKLSKPYHAKAKSENLDSRMTLIFSDGSFTVYICPVILYRF